jgi:hypothetical protein
MKYPKPRRGARGKLREYFIEHVGEVVKSSVLREVAGGISEYARRIRELRDNEGMDIHSYRDDSSLKQDEYRLVSLKPLPVFEAGISKEMRAYVLDRNGYTCQNCGVAAGQIHPFDGRKVTLHIGHLIDASKGGSSTDPANLRALCSLCNEGSANITPVRPELRGLLIDVRRSKGTDQLEILAFLIKKFPTQAAQLVADLLNEAGKLGK